MFCPKNTHEGGVRDSAQFVVILARIRPCIHPLTNRGISHVQLEASSPSEITAALLYEEFHPKKEEKTNFARPKRPGRR